MNFYMPQDRIDRINKLKDDAKEEYCVLFTRTETGIITHIVVDEITYCKNGTSPLVYYKETLDKEDNLCYNCSSSFNFDIKREHEVEYYPVSWRCIMKTNKKKLCKKSTTSRFDKFCKQHTNSIIKRLYKSTNITEDVLKIIIKMMS